MSQNKEKHLVLKGHHGRAPLMGQKLLLYRNRAFQFMFLLFWIPMSHNSHYVIQQGQLMVVLEKIRESPLSLVLWETWMCVAAIWWIFVRNCTVMKIPKYQPGDGARGNARGSLKLLIVYFWTKSGGWSDILICVLCKALKNGIVIHSMDLREHHSVIGLYPIFSFTIMQT